MRSGCRDGAQAFRLKEAAELPAAGLAREAVSMGRSPCYARIYLSVRRIPYGHVATYGQIARLAGFGGHARLVGYALHALPSKSGVPWHRVVNARGGISLPGGAQAAQRRLLKREGIRFNSSGRIDLATYGWQPLRRQRGVRGALREPAPPGTALRRTRGPAG